MEPEKTRISDALNPPEITEGDLLLGLTSCGVCTDDFPLDLDILGVDKAVLTTHNPELGCTVGEELQKPSRSYDNVLSYLSRRGLYPKAIVPITGSLRRSLPAILPPGLAARIETASFPVPPIFDLISRYARLLQHEMYEHFNMGIGMVIVISRQQVGQIKNALCCCGERAYIIGSVVRSEAGLELI